MCLTHSWPQHSKIPASVSGYINQLSVLRGLMAIEQWLEYRLVGSEVVPMSPEIPPGNPILQTLVSRGLQRPQQGQALNAIT